LDYARRLSERAAELRTELCVAMRVYFEKPRTTTGWKGLINDPHLDASGDVNAGLRLARRVLLDVLGLGLAVGCEFLDPITPQYISDAVCWGAIGARTTESQILSPARSGLSMAGRIKNRTDGNVQVAVDAVRAAQFSTRSRDRRQRNPDDSPHARKTRTATSSSAAARTRQLRCRHGRGRD